MPSISGYAVTCKVYKNICIPWCEKNIYISKVDQLQPEDVDQKPGKRKRKPNPETVPGTKANAPRQSPAKTPPTPNSEAGESHKMKKLSSSKTALPNGDLIKGNQTFGFYKQS